MKRKIKIIVVLLSVPLFLSLAVKTQNSAAQTKAETAEQRFKSIRVLNDMPADQLGKVMNMMSASLGVNCAFCHASNDGDYEKEGIEHKDTARKMIKMMFDLNKVNFNGRPEINCNTCHHGVSHPQPGFPLTPAVPVGERPKQPERKPTTDEIIARYETAVGGKSNLARVTSRQIKANRIEPDGKTTEAETIWLKGGKYVSDLFYGSYVVTEMFDGSEGLKFGNFEPIRLKADEAEQIKREGQLFWPADLKLIYPKMDYRAVDRIDGREVYLMTATTETGVRERLAFDVLTGFLVRRTAATPTVFGNFIYQVDYSDYKKYGGVKMPTTMHYAVPHISWTRKILDVKTNVPIDDAKFIAPGGRN
jgi:hypothetical protein